MIDEGNVKRWGLPKIINMIDSVDEIMAARTVAIKTNRDYQNLVVQTTAKAIMNMREIMVLLYNGFPDGALSRGRNIYEQAVILTFVNRNMEPNGNELIRRYCDDYQVKLLVNLIDISRFYLLSENHSLILWAAVR